MKKTGCIWLLLLLLASPVQPAAQSRKAASAQVLEVREFHGNEVKAKTGEEWLGLYVRKDRSLLIRSKLSIEAVSDPVLDEENGPKTGKQVRVDQPDEPLFLVKGVALLHVGPVTSIHTTEQSLSNGDNIRLDLGGQSYQLKVASRGKRQEGIISDQAKLLLTVGTTTQTLRALPDKGESEAGWSLIWAGDLDGDGKLDLYLDLSNQTNVSQRILFLSSPAGKGQLVRKIAELVTVGC